MRAIGFASVFLAMAVPALGQPVAQSVTASAPDPARLALAREVIDLAMPPAQRSQMISAMVEPMLANMRQGIAESPQFKTLLGADPRALALFSAFLERTQRASTAQMVESLPGMIDAMSRAYAREFNLTQLTDLRSFFASDTGRAYLQANPRIMGDPDVAKWTRDQMQRSFDKLPEQMRQFVTELKALDKDQAE